MKAQLLILGSVVMLTLATHAAMYTGGAFANSGYIPDGSAVGSSATVNASGLDRYTTDVTVTLNIAGGYNGDLYAYLSHGGVLVPLLTRVGTTSSDAFGYGTAGMTVNLADSYTDIHTVQSPTLNGFYSPDGRALNPATSLPTTYPGGGGDSRMTFGAYHENGVNPNGTWTLFLADMSSGAQSQVVSWSLDIGSSAVPEPANVALGIFAGVFLVVSFARSQWARNRVQRCRVTFVQWVNAV